MTTHQESSADFLAKITYSEPDNMLVADVWVYEFDPVETFRRSAREWVEEHYSDGFPQYVLTELGLAKEEMKKSWQILCKGTISCYYDDFTGEWDESVEYEEVHKVEIDPDTHPMIRNQLQDPGQSKDLDVANMNEPQPETADKVYYVEGDRQIMHGPYTDIDEAGADADRIDGRIIKKNW